MEKSSYSFPAYQVKQNNGKTTLLKPDLCGEIDLFTVLAHTKELYGMLDALLPTGRTKRRIQQALGDAQNVITGQLNIDQGIRPDAHLIRNTQEVIRCPYCNDLLNPYKDETDPDNPDKQTYLCKSCGFNLDHLVTPIKAIDGSIIHWTDKSITVELAPDSILDLERLLLVLHFLPDKHKRGTYHRDLDFYTESGEKDPLFSIQPQRAPYFCKDLFDQINHLHHRRSKAR